jgi:hypothetical protein
MKPSKPTSYGAPPRWMLLKFETGAVNAALPVRCNQQEQFLPFSQARNDKFGLVCSRM